MKMSGKIFLFVAGAVALGIIVGTFLNREGQKQMAKSKVAKAIKQEPAAGDTVVA